MHPHALLASSLVAAAAYAAGPELTPAKERPAQPAAEPDGAARARPAGHRALGVTEERAPAPGRDDPAPASATEPQADGNWLADASFEGHLRWDEGQPWWNPLLVQNSQAWVEFDVAEGRGRDGSRAALLTLDSTTQPGPTRVHGVVQQVSPPALPRYVSGWYLVEGWERGTPRQYLQTVVIAQSPDNAPRALRQQMRNVSVQTAITLAGVAQPPLFMVNRRFELTGPLDPPEGEWTFFEFDLHEMFKKHWRLIPEGAEGYRVFFEVRYDGKQSDTPAKAVVLFDDLYFGDESRATPEGEADAAQPPAP